MTNFQVVLSVVVSSIIYILFLFFAGYFFKAWGKVIVYIPGFDGFCPRFVKSLDGSEVWFTLVFDRAFEFGSVRKARKAVRKLEDCGIKNAVILELFSVHKTGWRKSLPWC